ncbi:antitoxin family protein [Pyrococcus kukulkanii]|uniref:antitoxin family protein n=1 Tax=Pyrococcus kukulkanii TaxID=1609559 RepID=UPI0035650D18
MRELGGPLTIEVIYENGVLKPLKPLNLKDGEVLVVKIYKKGIVERTEKFRKIITPEKFKESPEEYLARLREERR